LADENATEDIQRQSFGKIQVLRRRFAPEKHPGLHVPPLGTFYRVLGQSFDLYSASVDALREFKPDVIECQEFNGLGFYFANQHEFPLVIRCHGPLATLMRSGILGEVTVADTELVAALELSTLAEADGIISLCQDLVDILAKQAHIKSDRFRVVRTPFSRLPSQQSTGPVGESESIWPKDAFPRLMFWGRVQRQKGCDTIAACLPLVKKVFPNFALAIAGPEPIRIGDQQPYADLMRSELKQSGVDGNVKFLGFLERSKIESIAETADICLFPSQYETACYSCLEAMSYGACVIASKVGGLAEYVQHSETGWHVPFADASALADAIIHLSKEQELRKKLGQAAQKSVANMCDPKTVVAQSLEVYQQAIARHRNSNGSRSAAFQILAEKLAMFMADWSLVQHIRDLGEEIYGRGWKQGYAEGLAAGKAEVQAQSPANTRAANQGDGANRTLSSLLYSAARSIRNRFMGIA
jgi:glycosyltransferase involved in cell wall biosynthesis